MSVIQTDLLFYLLDARHVPFHSEVEMRCLAALEAGYSADETAEGLGLSAVTVRRHLAEIEHKVFDLSDLDPTRQRLRTWTRRHFPCCTNEAAKMIENNQIFDR